MVMQRPAAAADRMLWSAAPSTRVGDCCLSSCKSGKGGSSGPHYKLSRQATRFAWAPIHGMHD